MKTGTPASTPGARSYFQRPGPRAPRGRGYAKLITTGILAAIMIAVMASAFLYATPSAEAQTPPAELSTLSLSSGTLQPAFATATTTYRAAVQHKITQVTVTATAASGVTVEHLQGGATLNDADTTTTGFQVNLGVGKTSLSTKVTSGSITKLYTLSVERNSADLFGWTPTKDINSLQAAGNADPQGIWSDSTTMWVADDADDKLFAYTLSGGARDTAKEFSLHSDNGDPTGTWSDGTTIWVADDADDKLFAYTLSGGARDTAKEFSLHSDNSDPTGTWSDGTTIWVANNGSPRNVFAYTLSGGARDTAKEFNPTNAPFGMWSNGTTMWIVSRVSSNNNRVDAYRMDLNPDRTTGPNHGTRDNDKRFTPRANVGTVPVGIWSDTTGTVWITLPGSPKIDSYNMLPSSASSTTLSDLTVNDGSSNTKLRPAFASTTLSYRTSVTAFVNRVTVSATPSGGNTATVTYVNSNGAPLQDADSSTGGFQLDISTRETPIHILVTGQDGSALMHKAVVERDSSQPGGWTPTQDVYNLDPVAVHYPRGIWSDGTTMWLTNTAASTVFAYTMTTSTRDTSKEFSLDTDNSGPWGIWSDGTTMWVLDSVDRKAYAYTLATGARDSSKDFNLDPDNRDSLGVWSDGTTAWVSDNVDGKLYAYTLADGTRDTSKEFALTANSHPHDVSGIWSDGTTMWVGDIDSGSPKLVAYTLTDGNHDAAKDINLHRDRVPHGLWGRAGTIWVADAGLTVLAVPSGLHRVYAYNLPLSSPNDITLSSLSMTPSPRSLSFTPKMRPEFSYGQSSYRIAITNQSTRVTVNAVANNSATPVTYRDGKGAILVDASSSAPGFQVDVAVGETPIIIGLASGGTALTYSVVVERDSAALHGWTPTKDLNNLLDDNPDLAAGQMRGLWADETTLYLTPHNRTTIFAYTRATGARDATKDITTQYAFKAGIWSDGTTMWVLNYGYGENNSGTVSQIGTGKLFAFNLSTGMRDTAKEFALHLTERHSARGIWSDGTTVWVSDYKAAKLFAYTLATGASDADKDITLHSNNDSAQGIWSDGTTIWVAQWNSRKVYAYTLATGAYDPDNDFDRTPENLFSRDIWSDGTTLYVPDVFKKKVFSYNSIGDPVETVIVPPTEPITSDYQTWVDNRQGDATTEYANTGTYRLAQGFRTGNIQGIFEVHEIHIDFYFGQPIGDIKVSIVESTAPDDVWEFATPTDLRKGGEYAPKAVTTDGVHTFPRTSGNSALKSNTNYFLVIESSNDDAAEAAVVRMTPDDGEASNDGWTVDDFSHSQAKQPDATWTREQHQVRFRISGSYRNGIGMAGDSYAYESCPEVRRGEATGCTILIVAPEPADPSDPASWPKDVIKSSLVLDPDLFPKITQWWTGWWTRVYETLDFQVSMHPLPTGTDYVTLSYSTTSDSAQHPVDFIGARGSLRFDASGPHSHTVSLRIRDDAEEDSGEYMRFSIYNCKDQSGNSCDHLFVDDYVKGIIYNTEESKEISYLRVSDVTVTEGEGATAQFTVSLTSPVTAGVSFEYTTEDGTARDGADYTGGSGTAFIGNGDTSVTISVDIANDDTWTGDRSFTLKISDAVYAAISDDSGKATIRDDDPQPLTASFTNLPSGHDGESSFTFNISFNQDVATKYLVMQNDVMTVTNGEITGAQRVDGAKMLWHITARPVDGRAGGGAAGHHRLLLHRRGMHRGRQPAAALQQHHPHVPRNEAERRVRGIRLLPRRQHADAVPSGVQRGG